MRIAIMILCHTNPQQINLFTNLLVCESIDFFVHVDKKSDIRGQIISNKKIHVLDESKCIDVRWGEFSEVQATLNLLETAIELDTYDYYWLCSGQDFPIKRVDKIINWFEKNKGHEFVQLHPSLHYQLGYKNNYDKRNELYFPTWMLGNNFLKRIIRRVYIEVTGGYNRTFTVFRRQDQLANINTYFGSQWFCISDIFCRWALNYIRNNSWYVDVYKHCNCPDESFFQSLLMLSPYAMNRRDYLHYIDWSERKRSPKNLTLEDGEKLINSEYLMARKIDMNMNNDLIEFLLRSF